MPPKSPTFNLPINRCPVREHAINTPDSIAVFLDNERITYRQLDDRVCALSSALKQYKINKGEALAYCSTNSLEHIILLIACIRLGIVFCALSPRYSPAEKQQYLIQTGIKHYIDEVKLDTDNLVQMPINLKALDSGTANERQQKQTIRIEPHIPITITFTSGSSGLPKAAVHSYQNHFYSAQGSQQVIPLGKNDCWLASLPFYHIGGLAIVLRSVIAGATTAILSSDISTNLNQYPITHASLVPTQLYRLLNQHTLLSKQWPLRFLLLGGAPVKQQALNEIQAMGIQTYYSYGLTEMASQVATKPATSKAFIDPLPYRHWKIIDKEIWVSGETLFLGYMQQGKIQSAAIDGWFATKDLVKECAQGLNIVGRKDNMFISGGENYQPETMEAIINQSKWVKSAVIVGVEDDDLGHKAIAFVDWLDGDKEQQLIAYLRQQVSSIKIPKAFLAWPEALREQQKGALKVNRKAFQELADKSVEI